jgi:hypothetical protein
MRWQGILVETIQGEGGYIVPPEGFYPALRKLCDKHGILLILDEVQSGMGRTGKWWAIDHFGVEPDIITSAKGIASGMPLGACIARKSVMDWEIGAHGNTYGGNPISCAAALATIDLVENGFMQNAAEVGEYAMDALKEIQARHPSIGEVRGKGLMIGVEFIKDHETKEPAHDLTERVVELGYERGLLMLSCGKSVIRIAPPLAISKSEMDEGLKMFEKALTASGKRSEVGEVTSKKTFEFWLKGLLNAGGQAGLIALKHADGWRVAAAHGIAPLFFRIYPRCWRKKKCARLDVRELNRMLQEMTLHRQPWHSEWKQACPSPPMDKSSALSSSSVIIPTSSRQMTVCCCNPLQTRPPLPYSMRHCTGRSLMRKSGSMHCSTLAQTAF